MTGMIRIPAGTDLAAVLNDLLELTGTRPAELARLTGFAEGQISKWRRNVVVPSAPVLLRLFDGLGFDLTLSPKIETAPQTALSASVADQGAEIHTRVGVDHASGPTGSSGAVGRGCRRTVNECRMCETQDCAPGVIEPAPSAETIAGILAIVDAPYRPGFEVRLEDDDLAETYPGSGIWE